MQIALALLAGALLLAGCSSGPEPEDFASGICREAAPDVLELTELASDLGEGPEVDGETKAALREAQGRLIETVGASSGPERADLDGFVQAVGLLRLRADGNTYESFLGEDVRAAGDRVVAGCTTG